MLAVMLTAVLAGLLPRPLLAQLAPQRQWAVFRQADGLLSNDVYSVLVDDNALWFGSSRGVNRFDGRWQSYPISLIVSDMSRSRNDAAPGAVTAMADASHGDGIWIATDNGYVSRWDGVRWQLAAALGVMIDDMVDIDGVLWLATHQGLYLLDNGLLRTAPGLAGIAVHDIVLDRGSDRPIVWLGADDGLWRASLTAADLERVSVPVIDAADLEAQNISDLADLADADRSQAQLLPGPIEALWSDHSGHLWLGSGSVVAQFDVHLGLGRSFQPFEEGGTARTITDIVGTPGARIWIASAGAGVAQYMFDDAGLLAAAGNLGSSAEGGLDTDTVRSLAIDQDGTVWFASPVGVFRYQVWAWLEANVRLDALVVNDLLYDNGGTLWVATGGEGIQRRDGLYANPTFYYPSDGGLPSEFIYDLEEDPLGVLWAATAAGVAVYRGADWRAFPAVSLLPAPVVYALQADKQGLWIGTSGGLAYYHFGDESVRSEPFFAGRAIRHLKRDSLGNLWVAAGEGLWVSSADGGWRAARSMGSNAPPAGEATALLPDPSIPGGMYVALMDAGIYRWTGGGWANVDRRRWPRGDRIDVLALDEQSNSLWIGSEIGLSRLDALYLTTYDSHDGLQNGSIRAIAAEPEGGQWFGGQKGLSFYQDERTPPWIEVDAVSSPGISAALDGWRVYAGRTVQVNFVAGDMQSTPDKLKVFYRLNRHGVAEPWREAAASPLVLRLDTPDTVDLELMVRDQAFNYSPGVVRRLAVVAPPATVHLPLLGEVDSRIFQLLLLFGSLACFGFGYVSYEIFRFHHRVNEAIRRGYNPYISGEPVRREEMFYGRHDLLARIIATLHNNSIMIHGERRIGKTTLLYQLANALRQVKDTEYWFVPVMIDLEGTAEDQLFLQLGEEIYQTVIALPHLSLPAVHVLDDLLCHRIPDLNGNAAADGEPVSVYSDRDFGRDLRTVIHLLEQYCQEQQGGRQLRLILLLDEVDTLSHFNHIYQQQLRRIFMRDFAATVGAVVAGIAISKEWDRVESPWYNLFNEIAMQPFSRAEAIDLLVEPVRGYYLYEPAALAFILDNCDGRPFRIQQYALEAVNHMLKHKRRRILLEDVVFAHQQILTTLLNQETKSEVTAKEPGGPLADERPAAPSTGLGPAFVAPALR